MERWWVGDQRLAISGSISVLYCLVISVFHLLYFYNQFAVFLCRYEWAIYVVFCGSSKLFLVNDSLLELVMPYETGPRQVEIWCQALSGHLMLKCLVIASSQKFTALPICDCLTVSEALGYNLDTVHALYSNERLALNLFTVCILNMPKISFTYLVLLQQVSSIFPLKNVTAQFKFSKFGSLDYFKVVNQSLSLGRSVKSAWASGWLPYIVKQTQLITLYHVCTSLHIIGDLSFLVLHTSTYISLSEYLFYFSCLISPFRGFSQI